MLFRSVYRSPQPRPFVSGDLGRPQFSAVACRGQQLGRVLAVARQRDVGATQPRPNGEHKWQSGVLAPRRSEIDLVCIRSRPRGHDLVADEQHCLRRGRAVIRRRSATKRFRPGPLLALRVLTRWLALRVLTRLLGPRVLTRWLAPRVLRPGQAVQRQLAVVSLSPQHAGERD